VADYPSPVFVDMIVGMRHNCSDAKCLADIRNTASPLSDEVIVVELNRSTPNQAGSPENPQPAGLPIEQAQDVYIVALLLFRGRKHRYINWTVLVACRASCVSDRLETRHLNRRHPCKARGGCWAKLTTASIRMQGEGNGRRVQVGRACQGTKCRGRIIEPPKPCDGTPRWRGVPHCSPVNSMHPR